MTAASTRLEDRRPAAALNTRAPRRVRRVEILATVFVIALGAWIVSPRFSIHFPSMIDDWSMIETGPTALHHLVRFDYGPTAVRDPARYRPAFTAVWSSLEWHTLGAPVHLVGTNIWNLLRVALFLLAPLWLVVAAAPRTVRDSLWVPALAVVPPLLVLVTRPFGVDLARLGPVEPLLMGGMIIGALILLAGTARWLQRRSWRSVVPLVACGYVLWLLGLYQKETSVCFLVLAPFLYLHLAERWSESGTTPGPLWRQRPFQVVAAIMLAPLVHMLWEVKQIAGSGTTVYGAPIPSGTSDWFTRLHDAFDGQWTNMSNLLGMRLPVALAFGSIVAVAAAGFSSRRVPWLGLGLVATGFAVLTFQGLGGALATRYYLPVFVLFASALSVALLESPVLFRAPGVVVVALVVAVNAPDTHRGVGQWAQDERNGNQSVHMAAMLNPARCPVYMGSMITEYADALPELVARVPGARRGRCDPRFEAMLVYGRTAQVTPVTNEAIESLCADDGGWVDLRQTALFEILGCRHIKSRPVLGQDPRRVLAQNRLVPGQRYSDRAQRFAAARAPSP